MKALGGGDSYSTEITVVDNTDKYSDFVTFRTRKKHNQLELNDDGVIISEKLAKDLKVSVGDNITICDINDRQAAVKVTGIMEIYINNYSNTKCFCQRNASIDSDKCRIRRLMEGAL